MTLMCMNQQCAGAASTEYFCSADEANDSNESWEWLARIAPSVLSNDDIQLLAASLRDHRVYELDPGRACDPEDLLPKDVISEGYRRLAHGSRRTIHNYNEYFKNLQKQFRISPLSSAAAQGTPGQHPSPEGSAPEPGAGGQDDTADPAQDAADGEAGTTDDDTEEKNDDGDEEDDVAELFDWEQIEKDIAGLGFSDEEVDEDEESDSDEDLKSDDDVSPGEEFDSD
ncbi:hypothetical protein FRC09_016744 [Ceratobasidium sp. 395]|nr:hypothetical protein FRC09_016744 [Ceratobasidium sp. 395]